MTISAPGAWTDEFITSAAVARAGTVSAFYRQLKDGRFVTLAPGVHLPTDLWQRLGPDEGHRARVTAAAVRDRRLVFSHLSAAAMWRLPLVGAVPNKPDVTRPAAGGGVARAACRVHTSTVQPATLPIDGITVTALARTVVDVARTAPLGAAVAIADAALSPEGPRPAALCGSVVSHGELLAELDAAPRLAGRARARRVIELADGSSGSPGESVSRVGMYLEGMPRPVLQKSFHDRRGLVGFVDFWWPEFQLIGEFDGRGKYTREDMLGGRSPAEAVIAEKVREDRLRALGPRVVRWGWEAAVSPPRLARVLRDAGLR